MTVTNSPQSNDLAGAPAKSHESQWIGSQPMADQLGNHVVTLRNLRRIKNGPFKQDATIASAVLVVVGCNGIASMQRHRSPNGNAPRKLNSSSGTLLPFNAEQGGNRVSAIQF